MSSLLKTRVYLCALAMALGIGQAELLQATSGTPVTAAKDDVVLHAGTASRVAGAWAVLPDATAASGVRIATPDAGLPKLASAAASPESFFDLTFTAEAGRAYRLWFRGTAENDSWRNDSAFIQFSGSVDAGGAPVYRIGTTSATVVSLEESSGAGVSGWGWQDNGYGAGVLGAPIYFDGTPQTLRVQLREDGLAIDQIVLSPVQFSTLAPGAGTNDTTILAVPAPAPLPQTEIVLHAKDAIAYAGAWAQVADGSAAGGVRVSNPDAGVAKLASAAASPASYFELAFYPEAGRAYRLWVRGRAQNDAWQNDSAFVQFSGSLAADGTPAFRIGTTAATVVSVEEGSGAGLQGWGWQDNGYGFGTLGPAIYFDGTPQTLRVQVREDGLSLDQIVLSAVTYATVAPGATKNDSTILTATTTSTAVPPSSSSPAPAPAPASAPAPEPEPEPTPAPAPTEPGTAKLLRVLEWNTRHGGFGTDNIYDTERLATWIVRMQPDVVMLNEIERYTGWGNEDQPEVYKNLLQNKTGKIWYYTFAQEWGQWSSPGKGNMILSTVPFVSTSQYALVNNWDRSIAQGVITWNGRPITLMVTHLDPYSHDLRLVQAREVTTFAAPEPENRILAGDMNAWPDQTSIAHFNTLYHDSWAVALAQGTAVAFEGNSGQTKRGRIDYIYLSKGSADLSVVSSQVFDTRDANGVMPSDHRPVLTTFSVR